MEPSVDTIYPWQLEVIFLYLRYILLAGLAYFLFYQRYKDFFKVNKIQAQFPVNASIYREIFYSVCTLTIYAVTTWFIYLWQQSGTTAIYTDLNKFSYLFFVISILLMIVVHDTYFYWTHRFMHSKKIFKYIHLTHHLSVNPTPFAAFAFHPLEALISVGYIPIIIFFIPSHPYALFIFLGYMCLINVMGHLGYETFPAWFRNSIPGRWLNTSTNHNLHHQEFKTHFGLYFTFWDRVMGTMRK